MNHFPKPQHLAAPLVIVAAVGCAGVTPVDGSEDVEIVSKSRVGVELPDHCERLGDATSHSHLMEHSASDSMSVVEVRARNQAHEQNATHVAVGSPRTYRCSPQSIVMCRELPATAYKCPTEQSSPQTHQTNSENPNDADRPSSFSDETVTIAEAAEICGSDRQLIRDAISSGGLNAINVDDTYLLSRTKVLEFCLQHQKNGQSTL